MLSIICWLFAKCRNTNVVSLEKAKESQIKDEEQLIDIKKSIKCLSDKFDEYENEREKKDEIVKQLQCNDKVMEDKLDKINKSIDWQEQ